MKIFSGLLGGLIVSILFMILVGISIGAGEEASGPSSIAFFIAMAYSVFIAVRAESVAHAWKRLMIHASIFSFLLPISSMIFTAQVTTQAGGGAEVAGAVIGGGIVTMISGFLGFFLGIVFLIISFAIGKKTRSTI
jgi:hypothetical protein